MPTYPPQHQPMPPGSSGSGPCGAYAGYLIYNNSGQGYTPDPGVTLGVVVVKVAGAAVLNTRFYVLWRAGAVEKGCAGLAAGSNTQRSFACSSTKRYVLTVYFTPGNCPKAGSDVVLELTFPLAVFQAKELPEPEAVRAVPQRLMSKRRNSVRSRGKSG